jgi:hypothetical protein
VAVLDPALNNIEDEAIITPSPSRSLEPSRSCLFSFPPATALTKEVAVKKTD